MLASLDFRRAEFGYFRDLFHRLPQNKSLRFKRGPRKLVNTQRITSSQLRNVSSSEILSKRKSGGNFRTPAWMSKELLDKTKCKYKS